MNSLLFVTTLIVAQNGQMTVTGEASVNLVPDYAMLQFAVTTGGLDPNETLTKNNAAMKNAVAAIKAAGVEDKCVQTSGFSLGRTPAYSAYSGPPGEKASPFVASNHIHVTVHKLPDLGRIMSAIVAAGVNDIGRVSLGVSTSRYDRDDLERKAVEAAMAKAAKQASYAKMRLGAIKELQVGRSVGYTYRSSGPMTATADPVPIESGENKIAAVASITYELIPMGQERQILPAKK
jgi:uncharacterized protein YggE